MAFRIDKENGHVWLTRGDAAKFSIVTLNNDESKTVYTAVLGDTATFIVKSDLGDASPPLIEKETTPSANMQISLDPSDTQNLATKDYHYGVRITLANGEPHTIIPDAIFTVERSV